MSGALNIDPVEVESAIKALNKFVEDESIKPLISILELLKKDPESQSLRTQVSDALNDLGVMKGAVLTYAPYVWNMLSEDPFGEN